MDSANNGKGISDYQNKKRKCDSLDKFIQRMEEAELFFASDAGKEWKERQLMAIEDNLSELHRQYYMYETYYNEHFKDPYLCDSDDEKTIQFGRKHVGKTFRQVFDEDKNYVNWINNLNLQEVESNPKRNRQFVEFLKYVKTNSFFNNNAK